MEWTAEGIVRWLYMHDIYGKKTPSEQRAFENAFIDEANKHQDTATDRKLYRGALKIIQAHGKDKERKIQSFLQLYPSKKTSAKKKPASKKTSAKKKKCAVPGAVVHVKSYTRKCPTKKKKTKK